MSRLTGLSPKHSKENKYLPSRAWGAFVWKNWVGYGRWDKQQIIRQAYERNAPYYAAANIVAQTVSDLPVYVEYEVQGKRLNTTDHPILDTLDRNESREEFIEKMTLYLVVTGETYANIVFSSLPGKLKPLGLICLPSQFVSPIQGDTTLPIKGYELLNNKKELFQPHEMIHIYKPDLNNPFKGMSPGVPLSELIDLNNAAITWNKNIALAGGTPPIVAKAPMGMLPEEAREIIDRYEEQSGANNAHRMKMISGDLELQEFNVPPHDAEWEKAVLMSMRMIFMSLGVSSSLMNDAANKTYNNVKDSRKALYLDGCLPIGERIYKVISKRLRPYYHDNPIIIPDRSAIEALQEDAKAQAERLSELKLSGIISANEARSVLKWPNSTEPNANLLETSKQPSPVKQPEQPANIMEE